MLISRSLTGLLTVALLGLTGSPALAGPEERRVGVPLAVTGYALGDASAALVHANAPGMRTLSVDGIGINAAGTRLSRPSAAMLALVDTAHADGLRAELLVSNYRDQVGDFDTDAVDRLLGSARHVTRAADAIAAYAVAGGWDGVNIDLEALRRSDGRGLVSLLDQLRQRLPPPMSISILRCRP